VGVGLITEGVATAMSSRPSPENHQGDSRMPIGLQEHTITQGWLGLRNLILFVSGMKHIYIEF